MLLYHCHRIILKYPTKEKIRTSELRKKYQVHFTLQFKTSFQFNGKKKTNDDGSQEKGAQEKVI